MSDASQVRPERPGSLLPALIVVVLALAVRSLWLSRLGLHLDEDITTLAARAIAHTGRPELPSGNFYWRAPLFHYLLAPFAGPGIDWLPRVFTVLLSALTAVLIVRGGAPLIGRRASIIAGLIFAFSIVEIAIARQIRMYALYQPIALAAILLVHRFWRTGELRWGWLAAAVMLLALSTHELSVTLALLFLPVAIRHPRASIWAFAIGAIGFFGYAYKRVDGFLDAMFCGGAPRFPEHLTPEGMTHAPFRAMMSADPVAFARGVLGSTGLVAALAVLAVVALVLVLRATPGRPLLLRLAGAAAVAAALLTAGLGLPGIALAVLILVALHRRELLPGERGVAAFGWVVALVVLTTVAWVAIGVGRGLTLTDLALGMTRWPWRFARLLLWPPMIAIAAVGGALWIGWRRWFDTDRESHPGESFLVIAIAWLVIMRGALGDRTQVRFLADVAPLWEMLAAAAVVALVAATRRALGGGAALATTATILAATLLLPGTSPRDIIDFVAREPGSRKLAGEALDTPAADIRSAGEWLRPRLAPGDLVVASDWLTTYTYVGRMDGWIRSTDYGWQSTASDGGARECYLGARVLTDLGALLEFAVGHRVWVVAGGQELMDYSHLLSPEVRAFLLRQTPAFTASDGETRVYVIGPLAR